MFEAARKRLEATIAAQQAAEQTVEVEIVPTLTVLDMVKGIAAAHGARVLLQELN